MPSCNEVYREIMDLTSALIRCSLVDRFNYPSRTALAQNIKEISVQNSGGGIGFGSAPYKSIYLDVEKARSFNYRFLDGAMILLQYLFERETIVKHRLSFWASPDLEAFQNDPELYSSDELYADFIEPSIVPFPFRFDYAADAQTTANTPLDHPRSHASLGYYKNCRIPVAAPLSPGVFIEFILRSFYNTAYRKFTQEINFHNLQFERTIFPEELRIIHFNIT